MIGGRFDLCDKLKGVGLEVFCIDEESATGSTLPTSDFFVINTKFISHKVVRMVQSQYKNQLDTFLYYNGTNIDNLIRASYDFIYQWLMKGELADDVGTTI
jgi:hypothetical protein